jgi:hypothetical protein
VRALTPAARRSAEDGGTLIMAMLVMLVLSTLSLAALTRTLSSLQAIRHGQDYDAALAAADGGLSDALYAIDQSAPETFSRSGGSTTSSWRYRAVKKSATEYEVRSIGTVGRSSHGVRAKVTRTARYPYALFSNQDLILNGNSSMNIYSFATLGGPRTGRAMIGSNHQIVVNSGKGAGDAQHYFAPFGGCTGCPNPVPHTDSSYHLAPVVAPTGATQTCPAGGHFSGAVDGAGGLPFVCREDVVLTGTIDVVNPPFVLFVLPTAGIVPAEHHALDISAAVVNPTGRSRDVQISKAGDAPLLVGNGNTSATRTFNGIMDAPESTVTVNGGKYWTGSWVVNSLEVNGAPNVEIGYDLDLETYLGNDWKVSRYAEVPSASLSVE